MKKGFTSAIVLGAGPAGLACALELAKNGVAVTVVERNDRVGGLARTEEFMGYKFDVGPHRFFTKSKEIMELWTSLLGKDFVEVDRLTRIFYKGKYFLYPIKLQDALPKLGFLGSIKAGLSYVAGKTFAKRHATTFEEWAVKAFGYELYKTFFKTYTEKVWGISCKEIGAEWAAQRIKNVNIGSVLRHALQREDRSVKSLVERFHYPTLGAGMMYEAMKKEIEKLGGTVQLNARVKTIVRTGNTVTEVVVADPNGTETSASADQYFSGIPITEFVGALSPAPTEEIAQASRKLRYRGHITANLIVRGGNLFPDNWIYVHSSDVKMARLANYNNFSGSMSPDVGSSALSVEYFAFPDDEVWSLLDVEILNLAVKELDYMGLIKKEEYVDGYVIREEDAYPVYYLGHKPYFEKVKEYVSGFENAWLIGRGGQYRYDNQDHAMLTGLYAARQAMGEEIDAWAVNEDEEYHEEVRS